MKRRIKHHHWLMVCTKQFSNKTHFGRNTKMALIEYTKLAVRVVFFDNWHGKSVMSDEDW